MKVLVTSSRFPFALGLIRRLGAGGHEVLAADTYATAPGSHSKYVAESLVTVSPKFDTKRYCEQIAEIVAERAIDLVMPCFEEVFYLAKHMAELGDRERYFFPSLDVLTRLHDKARFVDLARELEVPVARTIVARTQQELRDAIGSFREYFARATFSRGGVQLLTNSGPLSGAVAVEDCHPTAENPWLVQEFVHGEDLCSFSVARRGKLVAHCTYRHPLTIDHAGGIVFESVDEPESLAIARRVIEACGYHGHISFDYLRRSDDGRLELVECNPRPTAGVLLFEPGTLSEAIFGPASDTPHVVPAGVREQIAVAVIRDMFRNPDHIPRDLHALASGGQDVYAEPGDRLPLLYTLLSLSRVTAFRHQMHAKRHKHSDLVESQFFDIDYDGGTIV
jgi:predicted ATP-grasp superfamily ATP-dependent carboligase